MRAVCLTGPRTVAVLDVPTPSPGPGQVRVDVRAVGLCGSDLAVYDGAKPVPSIPWVLGHECGGTVGAVGAGVDRGLLGRQVVVEPNIPCHTCAACSSGVTSLCPDRVVLGMNAPGVMAEHVVVPATVVWPVPDTWAPQQLASLEPLAVAVAALRRAALAPGQSVLVLGAGSLGVQAVLALAAQGYAPAVLDVDPGRTRTALAAGAVAHADGARYDVVLETAGAPAALGVAVGLARPGGRVVLTGLSTRPSEIRASDVVRGGLTLVGSIIYDHPGDFREAIELAAEEAVVAGATAMGGGIPPERADEAFEGARARSTKSWVDCSRWPGG